jgi:ribose 5-phosphate isomerase B
MKIAVACDHRGYEAKRKLIPVLRNLGHVIEDFGCESTVSVDYPDYALPAAKAVGCGVCDLGILLDGRSIAANKVIGVRAALVHDEVTAVRAREHNHCNILCLGTDLLSEDQIKHVVLIFLNTPFGEGRHARRIEKLRQFETSEQPLPG